MMKCHYFYIYYFHRTVTVQLIKRRKTKSLFRLLSDTLHAPCLYFVLLTLLPPTSIIFCNTVEESEAEGQDSTKQPEENNQEFPQLFSTKTSSQHAATTRWQPSDLSNVFYRNKCWSCSQECVFAFPAMTKHHRHLKDPGSVPHPTPA